MMSAKDKFQIISNPLTSELLSLSSLSLCPLCPLWFNHSDTTGIDISPGGRKLPIMGKMFNTFHVNKRSQL